MSSSWEQALAGAEGASTLARSTLAVDAHAALREALVQGRFAPGEHLAVRPITEQLGISPTPVRMALAQLASEGLLEARDRRGYFVPERRLDDILDIYEVRETVDAIVARRVANTADLTTLLPLLRSLLARMREAVDQDDLQAYARADVEFHTAIFRGADPSHLEVIALNLLGHVRASNQVSARAPGRVREALAEHEAMVDAFEARDAERAEQITRDHVRRARLALARSTGTGPD